MYYEKEEACEWYGGGKRISQLSLVSTASPFIPKKLNQSAFLTFVSEAFQ